VSLSLPLNFGCLSTYLKTFDAPSTTDFLCFRAVLLTSFSLPEALRFSEASSNEEASPFQVGERDVVYSLSIL